MLLPSDILKADFWEQSGCVFAETCDVETNGIDGAGGVICFKTSGSTARPKWIVLRKSALLLSAKAVNRWLDVSSESRWGLALPIHHVGGFGVVARAYTAGCELRHFSGKWNASDFAKWLEQEKVSHVSLVPTQLHDLVKLGLRGAGSLRAIVVGGGKLSEELGQAARDLGWPVLASYGMTEACSQVATQKMDLLDLPYGESPMELLPIWQAKTSAEGLLQLRGEALFSGTIEQGFFQKREGQWFTSNDRAMVFWDRIVPLGRSDALVKVMGELVNLDEVERRFAECSEGLPFAVVAICDSRREHGLVLCSEGDFSLEVIAAYQAKAIGPERLVKWVRLDELPRSDLGKIKRHELRELVQEMDGVELL
jgi:o-succinylbenzoate---CoA ligase